MFLRIQESYLYLGNQVTSLAAFPLDLLFIGLRTVSKHSSCWIGQKA